MPLSEQEQRLLDEMERNLYHGDTDFSASASRARVGYTAVVGGVLLALAGVVVLVLGVASHIWIVGVLGFVLMFGGVLIAVGPGRRPLRGRGPLGRIGVAWGRRRRR